MIRVLALIAALGAGVATERPATKPFLDLPPALDEDATGVPVQLSGVGAFTDVMQLTPAAGVAPYTVNVPLWSDGATKQRWLAVPAGERLGVPAEGRWSFPRGTVFVKHFELPKDLRRPDGEHRRLETRVLAVRSGGDVYGVTYRWEPGATDATLVSMDGAQDEIDVIDEQGQPLRMTWNYPTRESCITCHTPESGGVLGVSTQQWNRAEPGGGNQLARFAAEGWLDRPITAAQCADLPRLRRLDEADVPLETRVRSYVDANCAGCHHPASRVGDGAFSFDLRVQTPLHRQGVIDGVPANALGIEGGRIVVPGKPALSVMLDRVARRDEYGMPPVGTTRTDAAFQQALHAWIAALPAR